MKVLLFLGLLLGLVPQCACVQAGADTLARYQQVVPVPGASADDLYARAREWVALTFEDVHQVVQLDDPQRHLLIGSGFTRVAQRRRNGALVTGTGIWFRFRLETRAGRYRVELTDLAGIESFAGGQFAAQDIGFWLASTRATRLASARHSLSLGTKQQASVVKGEKSLLTETSNFEVLGVSLDDETTRQQWGQAIADDQTPWVQVSDLQGFEGEVVQQYGIKAIPQNFLIDPSGVIVASSLQGSALLNALATFVN